MTGVQQIFIIDRDPSVRRGLTRLLATAGHAVVSFDSVEAFLAEVGEEKAGCLLLDATAIDSLTEDQRAELCAHGDHLAVIVTAVNDGAASRRKARTIKALAFLRKPVDGLALLDTIRWALR